MNRLGLKALAVAGMVLAGCAGDEQTAGTKYDQGFELLASQEYAAAEVFFAQQVEADPDDPYALLNLAAAQEAQGDFGSAAKNYQEAARHGSGARVGKTVYNGQVKAEDTTVTALAAYNLANLPQ